MDTPTLTLYYDGLCPLCSREVAHYRNRTRGDETVRYVDIADPAFDAAAHGLDARRVHRVMHVKVGDAVHTGLDAFIAIWGRVRGFGWLGKMARWPGVYQLLWLGYQAFAAARPLLPRRKVDCSTGACKR